MHKVFYLNDYIQFYIPNLLNQLLSKINNQINMPNNVLNVFFLNQNETVELQLSQIFY